MKNNNNTITFGNWTTTSASFSAILSHLSDKSRYEVGVVISDSETDMDDLMLKVFRELWQRNGLSYDKAVVTFTTHYDFHDGTTYCIKDTIEGTWLDTDEEVLATHKRTSKRLIEEEEGA